MLMWLDIMPRIRSCSLYGCPDSKEVKEYNQLKW